MKIDAVGLLCPEPIMMLHRAIQKISEGEKVELYATDPSTERDICLLYTSPSPRD